MSPPAPIDLWRRVDADIAAKRDEVNAANERLNNETSRRAQARVDLTALERGGEIADDAALARARAHRDTGWRLIYRRAFTTDAPSIAEEQAFAPDVPLPLAFERALSEADTIADLRARDSEMAARLDVARRAVADAEKSTESAEQRSRLTAEALRQTRQTWTRLCASIGQAHDASLADVQAFLNARDQVIDELQRRTIAVQTLNSLLARQNAWTATLTAALETPLSGLPMLLLLADRTLDEAARQRAARAELETLRTRTEKERHSAIAAHAAANASLEIWRDRWRLVLSELGRPEAEEPAETEAVLQTMADVQAELRDTTSLAERIEGMNADIGRFTMSVHELRGSLPGLTEATDPFEAVRDLDRELDQERGLQQRQRVLRDNLTKAHVASEAATRALTEAQAKLRAILTVIGADAVEAATQRLAFSDERAAHETKRDEAEAELRQAGDGYSIAELLAEAAGHPSEEDTARIEAASAQRKTASDAAQQAAEDASRVRQTMDQQVEATGVNTAAADQQAAIASISRTLDEALLYHTASLLLSQALDAVEQSGGSEMLRRLSAIFQALTCGLYSRVASEPDDNNRADLVMIQRDFPEERQRIGQLSEGTRDQLFLALRVAAIEDHLKSAEPLPFIGDDILQTFDDDRALATLRVLADLSQHTQVVLLTHHRHILELAAHLPEGTVFECRREGLATTA